MLTSPLDHSDDVRDGVSASSANKLSAAFTYKEKPDSSIHRLGEREGGSRRDLVTSNRLRAASASPPLVAPEREFKMDPAKIACLMKYFTFNSTFSYRTIYTAKGF